MAKFFRILMILLLIVVFIGGALYKTMNARTFQFFGRIYPKVDTEEKVVALTFDDGPTEKTEEILEVLREAGIKATFFLVGSSIEENLKEAERIVEAGHELGNHTYSHKRMVFKTPSFVEAEIEKTNEWIRNAGYKGDIHFRPPNGKKLVFLPYYLRKISMKTIMWNIEPDSYAENISSAEKITEHVIQNIRPGSIILLHVMYNNEERESLESVKSIVSNLTEQGYTFKTVSELLEYQGK